MYPSSTEQWMHNVHMHYPVVVELMLESYKIMDGKGKLVFLPDFIQVRYQVDYKLICVGGWY